MQVFQFNNERQLIYTYLYKNLKCFADNKTIHFEAQRHCCSHILSRRVLKYREIQTNPIFENGK